MVPGQELDRVFCGRVRVVAAQVPHSRAKYRLRHVRANAHSRRALLFPRAAQVGEAAGQGYCHAEGEGE